VTAVSAYLRDETYRAFGCGQCEVRVIPNFISTADYHPPTDDSFRRRLAPKGHRVLVHVSNFRPVKRVSDVIKIFAGVHEKLPATLVLVGDGPDRDAAEHEVDGLGLRKDVRFLGKVENVGDVLRGADLFLLPSATESFGLAALEAMACVPCPWSRARRAAFPTWSRTARPGTWLRPACRDHDRARPPHPGESAEHERLKQRAASRALEFAADKVVPRYEALYEEVLS
jgi:N-acetyl-alpha-D-glucosaminyl L-malate synthase BshA